MNRKIRQIILGVIIVGLVAGLLATAGWFVATHNVQVLNAQGTIAQSQRSLMLWATFLMLLVVLPVFVLTFGIAWHFREGNTKATYTPDWDHNKKLETAWWLIPLAIITILAGIAWQSSHDLDPFKPLASNVKPLTIQVVALQWKWLFIYPSQHIATINAVAFPEKTPVDFEITSDAPMNSFWIPQLAGQIYAMSGMSTQLHLMADHPGTYAGSSANISGEGFAGMRFTAQSLSQADFDDWVHTAGRSPQGLDQDSYNALAQPSQNNQPVTYSLKDPALYAKVVMKYMGH